MTTHSSILAWRSPVGYRPWGCKESERTEWLIWTENGHAQHHTQDSALHTGSLWPHPCQQHWALTVGKDLQMWHAMSEQEQRGPFLRFPTKKGFYETHYTRSPITYHTACYSQSAFTSSTTTALPIIPRDPPKRFLQFYFPQAFALHFISSYSCPHSNCPSRSRSGVSLPGRFSG